MDESQTPAPAQNEVVEAPNQPVQPASEPTTSVPAPDATEVAPEQTEAQAAEPKVSNAEKRQERTRKAFSELLAEKKAVEQENQQLKASPQADPAKTTPPSAEAPVVEPPTLTGSGQDGEITAKDIETYTKAVSEFNAQAAVKPLLAENEQLKQLLEQTQGNVQQLSVAEIQKQDSSDARDLVKQYDVLNKDKAEAYDESLEQDLLSKFNALRQVNPSLRLKDYFEAEMGALEDYAERIANNRNTQQDKLAAEAPVQTEGAVSPPDVKSLHWKELEKKIGFA